jgi:hypothetical protein
MQRGVVRMGIPPSVQEMQLPMGQEYGGLRMFFAGG